MLMKCCLEIIIIEKPVTNHRDGGRERVGPVAGSRIVNDQSKIFICGVYLIHIGPLFSTFQKILNSTYIELKN